LVTLPLTRLRHIRKLDRFNSRRITSMTCPSVNPVRSSISSKLVRSSQAYRITSEICSGVWLFFMRLEAD
jgi:hypothetical protein